MTFRLTVLCENSVEHIVPGGLIGEHGFACHLRTPAGDYLFDTGGGLGLAHNSRQLKLDLAALQAVILSHGHRDHSGGLPIALQRHDSLPVYAHPLVFRERYGGPAEQRRAIGLPQTRAELEALGARFRLSRRPQQIAPGILLSGEVPRRHPPSLVEPNLTLLGPAGQLRPDPLEDDQSLFLTSDRGLVILLGCAHAGLLNIIDHARALTGIERIHLLLGGTHLNACPETQLEELIRQLAVVPIDRIGVAHCTGRRPAHRLAEHFPAGFFYASVGKVVEV